MVVWKDLLLEFRTKDMWVTMMAFMLMVIFMFGFAVGAAHVDLRGVFPGILWMSFLFAGMIGIGRSFSHEVPEDALLGLVLAPGDRMGIFLAKVFVAFLFMMGMELLATPVFFVLFNEPWVGSLGLFLLILVLGAVGFVGVGVLLSAIAANTRAGDVLIPVALVPLEVPVMITAVQSTTLVLSGNGQASWQWIHGLMAYDVIFLALPLLIYEYLWEV